MNHHERLSLPLPQLDALLLAHATPPAVPLDPETPLLLVKSLIWLIMFLKPVRSPQMSTVVYSMSKQVIPPNTCVGMLPGAEGQAIGKKPVPFQNAWAYQVSIMWLCLNEETLLVLWLLLNRMQLPLLFVTSTGTREVREIA